MSNYSGNFSYIEQYINNQMIEILTSNMAMYINFVISIVGAGIALWLCYQAYLVATNQMIAPIKTIMYQLITMVIIVAFATNSFFINEIIAGLEALKKELGQNGQTWGEMIDDLTIHKFEIFAKITESNANFIMRWIVAFFCLISAIIMIVVTTISLILNEIVFKMCLYLAPIFIYCASFKAFRNMFASWLQVLFSSIIFIMMVNTFLALIIGLDRKANFDNNTNGLAYMIFSMLIAFLTYNFIGWSREVARNIASVSADGMVTGLTGNVQSGANKLAGKSAQLAGRGLAGAGKGIGRGIGKIFGK